MTSAIGRPTVAYIDAAALRDNLAAVRAALTPGTAVMAVVKADGYGHGATLVAPVLAAAGADQFGVATVDEGVELRAAGIAQPIVVLTGARRDEVEAALVHRLSVAVVDVDMARELAAAVGAGRLPVHLKLDTGMGRLGTAEDALPALIEALRDLPQLEVEGVFSHFADADSVSGAYTDEQLRRFRDGVATLRAAGVRPRQVHLANSAAALTRADAHFDVVRPGLILYGVAPATVAPAGWRPAMHLRTRVWQLKSLPAGRAVSYGQTFVTRRPSRLAVLPIGYADGYARALSNRAEVVIRGRRAPVVGRVCMDLTLVDVTDVPGAAAGDEVLLWGQHGEVGLSVGEVAAWQDTIAYEVLTRLGARVPRQLVEGVP